MVERGHVRTAAAMMKQGLGWMAVACLCLPAGRAEAIYSLDDVKRVPVERLIRNLEAAVKKNPKDIHLMYSVARVHSIAYARDVDKLKTYKGGYPVKQRYPFFGYGRAGALPFEEVEPRAAADRERARAHLDRAMEWYREVLKTDSRWTIAYVGLAWCLEQAGDVPEALRTYRTALTQAWAEEGKARSVGEFPLTVEIAANMLRHLDAEKDAEEIARLRQYAEVVSQKPRLVTPIVVPLGPVVSLERLVNPRAGVTFDLDGEGPRSWGWISPEAGWLVYDHDGHGQIQSGLQMMGSVSFWVFWKNGYEALASLDDDGDGRVSGPELAGLAIWRDANGNGISEPGEVAAVRAWGITALSCRYGRHESGIPYSPAGVRFEDGRTAPTYDWIVEGR